ncbi:DUF3095 family protein [Azospirillum rugosum]|uniref:DUF3095 family protein n=1 Tax=Azospirillum rugosum TaxID=416170 RepID=A0ABS4SS34_9PROT|nr:DUF3095 family protein [Azospirillum rugosum]MBP2295367.1 hypothetical protein [Azospirillum rugosum]MDQ0528742.1 hypothetical protein [Azospirillum rugosum]
MRLPSIHDFAAEATDPGHYAALGADWSLAVADVVASTRLAAEGRHRDVNFVAAAVVAVLSEAVRDAPEPAACQFGGDGAIAAVPPGREAAARAALAALAHWAATDMDVPLRVGLVPVSALLDQGLEVLAALHDFGNGNAFGLFLGSGVAAADAWVKSDPRWSVAPAPGPLTGLEAVSCRWNPVRAGRGTILCVIVDPLAGGAEGLATLARVQADIERIVPTAVAAPLGMGERLEVRWPPSWRSLWLESRTHPRGRRIASMAAALAKSAVLAAMLRLGLHSAGFDPDHYRRSLAERSDFRKSAGGPRFVLDVTEEEAAAIDALLRARADAGLIRYGTARAQSTTVTCLVGDFAADRHVHFVDGAELGFWRASVMLKAMKAREAA